MGSAFAHTLLSMKNILNGLDRVTLDKEVVLADLKRNPVIIAEAIQSILRSQGYDDAYEIVKDFVRNNRHITEDDMHRFIEELEIDPRIKERLNSITTINYIGI